MSKVQTIAKLEALLARIRSRANGPRGVQADVKSSQVSPREIEVEFEQPIAAVATAETVVSVVAEEAPAGITLESESRERLVAAERTSSEPQVAVAEIVLDEPAEPDLAPELLAEPADVEDAPASSRRPVAPEPEERLAEIAFGAEEPQPARHTPPPESGRLPAAPPVEYDGDVTGVHEAGRSAAIVPEATVADIAPSDVVADVVGAARELAPLTFVALLDASIAL